MLSTLILLLWGSLLAANPAHLKPGALTARLGRAHLMEDVLWVRYPHPPLVAIPQRLRAITSQLDAALTKLEENSSESVNIPGDFFHLLYARIAFVNDTLSLALEDVADVHLSYRPKRGLVDGLGHLSRYLFGTALDSDVQELRSKYTYLTNIAEAQNKAINLNCRHLARLDRKLQEVANYSNKLHCAVNKVFKSVDNLYTIEVLEQALAALETGVNSILTTNALIIQNLVDASRGRVTSNLLPFQDLHHVLQVGTLDHQLTPLFDLPLLHHYYPLLTSLVTSDAIVIHVPFKSEPVFEVYRLEPFPLLVNGSTMTLDMPPSVVLLSLELSLYAVGSPSDFQACKTEHQSLFFCAASLFAFLPLSDGVCEVALIQPNATMALSLCPYKRLVPRPVYHTHFEGFVYFLFRQTTVVSVVCPEGRTYKSVTGHLAIHVACFLRSPLLSTYPERLHEGFLANLSLPIYNLDGLLHLNVSHFAFVTNTLQELSFSNESHFESALLDHLPTYLSPVVHYPSLVIPLIIFVLILIPLICLVKRAVALYRRIQATVPTAD